MAPCPMCGNELDFVKEYGQWYCGTCQQYPYNQTSQTYLPQVPPSQGSGKNPLVIAIVVIVVIIVVIGVVGLVLANIWVNNLTNTTEYYHSFPTLRIDIIDGDPDTIKVKHIAGDNIDWSDYKMVITDNQDPTESVFLNHLSGRMTLGEEISFTKDDDPALADIDLQDKSLYTVEIYNIEENKMVWERNDCICLK